MQVVDGETKNLYWCTVCLCYLCDGLCVFLPCGLCILRFQHPHCIYLNKNKQVEKLNGWKPFQFHSVKETEAGWVCCRWTQTLWDACLQIVNHDNTHSVLQVAWAEMLKLENHKKIYTLNKQCMYPELEIVSNHGYSSFCNAICCWEIINS